MVAFYTWAMDSNIVPIIEVKKNQNNVIPDELKNKEKIIFSIHPNSVSHLIFGKNNIQFYARFKGVSFNVVISNDAVTKIFNKETGVGLEFNEAIEVNHIQTENEEDNPDIPQQTQRKRKLILIKKDK